MEHPSWMIWRSMNTFRGELALERNAHRILRYSLVYSLNSQKLCDPYRTERNHHLSNPFFDNGQNHGANECPSSKHVPAFSSGSPQYLRGLEIDLNAEDTCYLSSPVQTPSFGYLEQVSHGPKNTNICNTSTTTPKWKHQSSGPCKSKLRKSSKRKNPFEGGDERRKVARSVVEPKRDLMLVG